MIRALLWKEWREQRPVLLSGLVLLGVLPTAIALAASSVEHTAPLTAAAELTMRTAPFVLWPLIALAAGAVAIAPDAAVSGRLGFLLSRPAPRGLVWAVKAGAAAATTLIVIIATEVVGRGLARLEGVPVFTAFRWQAELPRSVDQHLVFLAVPAAVVLCLACAMYASACFPRPLTVVFAAGVIALLLLAGALGVWWRIDLFPRLTAGRMAWGPLLGATVLFGASAWTFARGEMLRGRSLIRQAALAGGAALATVVVSLGVAAAVEARSPGADALFLQLEGAANGRVMATAIRSDGGSRTVWVSDAETRRFVAATPRLAEKVASSPDGEWIAYLSTRSAIGRRSGRARVRVARVDGSSDRVVLGGLRATGVGVQLAGNATTGIDSGVRAIIFSQHNRWLAVQQDDTLYAVDLLEGKTTQRDLAPRCRLIGWRARSDRMVVHCIHEARQVEGLAEVRDRLPGFGPSGRLHYIDPRPDGAMDIDFALFRARQLGQIGDRPYDLGTLAFVEQDLSRAGGRVDGTLVGHLRAASPRGGSLERVFTTDRNRMLSASTGGDVIVWITYPIGRMSGGTMGPRVLWAGALGSEPRRVAEIQDRHYGLWVSPDGRWAVIERAPREGALSRTAFAISLEDGRRVELAVSQHRPNRDWRPVWAGPDRVAFLTGHRPIGAGLGEHIRARKAATTIQVHDLASGESWSVEPLR